MLIVIYRLLMEPFICADKNTWIFYDLNLFELLLPGCGAILVEPAVRERSCLLELVRILDNRRIILNIILRIDSIPCIDRALFGQNASFLLRGGLVMMMLRAESRSLFLEIWINFILSIF